MFQKILHFIKYNNATLVIIAVVLMIGATTFAAGNTDTLGKKQTTTVGVDNALLLSIDLAKMDMDFKISKIEQDEKYYYATFTYLDLDIVKDAWQYELKEKTRKITKARIDSDLGVYLAQEFKNIHDGRIKELTEAQNTAKAKGPEKRIAVTEYNGLIGKVLNLGTGIFPGYTPVKKSELPSPPTTELRALKESGTDNSAPDNLTQVYNNYISTHDINSGQSVTSGTDQNVQTPDSDSTVTASGTAETADTTGIVEIIDPANPDIANTASSSNE